MDISLKYVDIDQCDAQDSIGLEEPKETGNKPNRLNTFMGTHRCKKSTKCVPVPFQGFKRGSYHCTCKRGYYFPDLSASRKYFYGKVLEEEYDKMLRGEFNSYEDDFECLACSEGCEDCVDDSACVYDIYRALRYALLVINCLAVLFSLAFAALVYKYWQNKIFKASSSRFLEIIISGAIMMYMELLVSFPRASKVRCILSPWLHHVGFSLVYGSLALKTWRVVLIFRVRSARKMAITDSVLLRRLSAIVLLYSSYLTVWMVIQPPVVESSVTADKLKYERCTKGWFGYMILAADFVVLSWGMWLSFKVRKAPQVYNESRFISYATYNAMFIMCFINVLSAVLRDGSSPSMTYAMDFAYIHVTASVALVLLFSHKIFLAMAMKNDYRRTSPRNNILSVSSMEGRLTEELDAPTLGGENHELKLEIKRLASKVALLQSQLMTEQNRHVKKTGSS
ncbi:hypothetical protein OS493_015738 [Desmophyllum pertusum]|uniref:G-protein coupled receptors family 3 profile domain-containing protein n=1 Tax=Desmophyllum pertusum TaxID=174260 RepID=A0A9W9YPK1_9CNID|nr:hypothetical protein OS493_015738 [Desmophyllum pertusum]